MLDLNAVLFLAIYDSFHSQAVDALFSVITWGGNMMFWAAAGLILINRRKERPAVDLLVAGLVLILVVNALKYSFDLPRPFMVLEGVSQLTMGPMSNETDPGFPSFHAAMVTAGAVIIFSAYPRFKAPLVLLVLLVGLSRIYLGVHYPLDVVVGALIGLVVGKFFVKWKNDNRFFSRILASLKIPR